MTQFKKYKKELEAAIYEGVDGKFYIGGKVLEKVLSEAINEALQTRQDNNECMICEKPLRT